MLVTLCHLPVLVVTPFLKMNYTIYRTTSKPWNLWESPWFSKWYVIVMLPLIVYWIFSWKNSHFWNQAFYPCDQYLQHFLLHFWYYKLFLHFCSCLRIAISLIRFPVHFDLLELLHLFNILHLECLICILQ